MTRQRNRNQGNGHLSARSGLYQLGPVRSTGGGMWIGGEARRARLPMSVGDRCRQSEAQRARRGHAAKITLPKLTCLQRRDDE